MSYFWGHWYPWLGRLFWISKPGWMPSLAGFVTCVQRILEIQLWCDTCWPLGSQPAWQQSHFIDILVYRYSWGLKSKINRATASQHEVKQTLYRLRCAVSARLVGPEPAMYPGGPCPPPGPVKISHKKDGHQIRPHRFHVSYPPPTLPGRWIRYCKPKIESTLEANRLTPSLLSVCVHWGWGA